MWLAAQRDKYKTPTSGKYNTNVRITYNKLGLVVQN